MSLSDLAARVKAAAKRVAHHAAGASLAERRIRYFRERYTAAAKRGNTAGKDKARKAIIRWKARKYRAEDLETNWRTILKRRKAQKVRYQTNHPPVDADGFATWVNKGNGAHVLVAPWMVGLAKGPDNTKTNWLLTAFHHGWNGNLTSGVRTAAHSIELCYQICGAPTCSGHCAGATSNHNCDKGCPSPEGAIDAEDYYRLKAIFQEIGAPLKNDLPSDPVHFSYTGH